MTDFNIEYIKDQNRLNGLIARLCLTRIISLDIETVNWWNQRQEQVALIQIAYRSEGKAKVAVVDALAKLDLEVLRQPLEHTSIIKIIHNASFDASKLAKHYKFRVAPVYDTMAAARRNGERRYSLQAQAETHLGIHLDKSRQRSDWSRRPLDTKQIHYAALDAFTTLLLYEHQTRRKLDGDFQLKGSRDSLQSMLPLLGDLNAPVRTPTLPEKNFTTNDEIAFSVEQEDKASQTNLPAEMIVLLGIITELPTRYHPDQLAVSVGSEQRIGLAGWIIDRTLGKDRDLDEETAKLAIADLCARKLIRITETRRLEATKEGELLWQQSKSKSY